MTFKMRLLQFALPGAAALLMLAACPVRPHGPEGAAGTAVRGQQSQQPSGPFQGLRHEGRPYDVATSESLLTILAYRGGALAKAGHNHVIASHDLAGTVYIPADRSRTTFEIHFPVAGLTIDESQLRSAEGPDFPPDVPDSAKEGTRRNMLSEALLNGAAFPDITLAGLRVTEHPPVGPTEADVQMVIRDQTHSATVPIRYEVSDSTLTVTGEFPLKQSDLGLTPYSALLGALQVQDEMHVKFRVVAHAAAMKGRSD